MPDTDQFMDDVVALLAGLIRHESPDPPGNEKEIAAFVAGELETRGFSVTRDEFLPDRINVIARLPGNGSAPALIFSAHMDTMPIGDGAWQHDPFGAEIENGRMYGRGTADMKSGLAAMIAAATRLKDEGPQLSGDVILAFSAGESTGCIGAKRMVETGVLKDAGFLLVSEPSSLKLLSAETGALWLNVIAQGTSGHASGGGGDNAIAKLMAFLDKLPSLTLASEPHPLLGLPTIAVNGLAAGNAPNITPDRARATLDIRTLSGMDADTVIENLKTLSGDDFSFEIIDNKPPIETVSDDPFIKTCLAARNRVIGTDDEPGGVHYFSDSNVLVPALGIPRAIIGPGELGMSGQTDEWVSLDAVGKAVDIYTDIARELLRA